MKIRLGYACISKTLMDVTTSSTYTYTRFEKEKDFEKLANIIRSNLEGLESIIDYNIANHIHFFRMSSKIIPLATHQQVTFDYIKPYQDIFENIGKKIRNACMRVDVHPDQFCVLNSTKKEVLEATFQSLKYHYNLLCALEIKEKVLVLHVGGNVFGKEKALARFINQFQKLPKEIQECIVIENDDKIFDIKDCIYLHRKLKIPIVLDYHHYICNSGGVELNDYIVEVFESWKNKVPKIHFSSPKSKNKKEFRSHNDYIDVEKFIEFIEIMKKYDRDFDVMIEAKAKDEALFRLIRELRYKTGYQFIDETTFVV